MSEEGALVLIVDDFADNREMFAEFLQLSGFRVVQAATGGEAMARAFESVPDVVLMDMSLPDVDGAEATRRLKADPRTARVPVIALTGHPPEVAGPHGGGAFDGFLLKPCLPDVVVAEIRRVLGADARA
ncbi:MAG TPA: response regulator [Minicystis sp.]|nr:response regulator [Minicystis sp.]